MSEAQKKEFNGDVKSLQGYIKQIEEIIVYSSNIEDMDEQLERDPLVMHLKKSQNILNEYLIKKHY